jgi:hypothetical protein
LQQQVQELRRSNVKRKVSKVLELEEKKG